MREAMSKLSYIKADILTLWDNEGLIHTAIYIGGGKFWHKMGDEQSEFTSEIGVKEAYPEYETTNIRRLNT